MPNLAGIHEPDQQAASLFGNSPGTVVFTEAIGANPNDKSGNDYSWWSSRGYRVLVRLNNGYEPEGTIPAPALYQAFANRCSNFVLASQGCANWIIGNEPNHEIERPNGQVIKAEDYARCFALCRSFIGRVKPDARVIVAAVAPWNQQSGDWLAYLSAMYQVIAANGGADGLAIHGYTHGPDPALITSNERRNGWLWHFRTYIDQLSIVPTALKNLPIDITEEDQNDAWADVNSGYVQAGVREIDNWNQQAGTQKIYSLCLYRWPKYDAKYSFANKPGVQADFKAACALGLMAPQSMAVNMPENQSNTTFIPSVSAPVDNSVAASPARVIDPRLTQRGMVIQDADVPAGHAYWRLAKAQFFDHTQAGGRHHVYVEAVDENGNPVAGVPFVFSWPSGSAPLVTNGKSGFDAANQPFSEGRNAFNVTPKETGDSVRGIGMGEDDPGGWNAGEHTSTLLSFQRAVAEQTSTQPPKTAYVAAPSGLNLRAQPSTDSQLLLAVPYGEPVTVLGANGNTTWSNVTVNGQTGWMLSSLLTPTQPTGVKPVTPAPAQPSQPQDKFTRVINFILGVEGGYTPNDEGAPANFGINQGANPDLDVKNITREQAIERYRTKYYEGSGADKLDWPFDLLVTDAAVQHGEDEAAELLKQSGGNPWLFQGLRQRFYAHINQDSWNRNGKSWMQRMGDLLVEASK